jgi:hypothetical protein
MVSLKSSGKINRQLTEFKLFMTKVNSPYILLTTSIVVQVLSLCRLVTAQLLHSKVNVPRRRPQNQVQPLLPPVLPVHRLNRVPQAHHLNLQRAQASPPSHIILCLRLDATKTTALELLKISVMLARLTCIVTLSWQHLFPLRLRLEFQPT